MAYGLQIENPSGQLVISSEAIGLFCYGKMSPYSAVAVTGTATAASPGRTAGYQRYRINTGDNRPIIIAMNLPDGVRVGLRSVNYLGNGDWEVEAHAGSSADSDGFDTVEYYIDIWVYMSYAGTAGSYGLALYNSSGQLTFDSNAGVPLMARDYVNGQGGLGTNFTISSLTKPAFIGSTPYDETTEAQVAANTWRVWRRRGAWVRSGTTITKTAYSEQMYRYNSPSSLGLGSSETYDQPGFLVEGALLP